MMSDTMTETILSGLLRRVQSLEDKVHKLETDTLIEVTGLPPEVLAENGLLPDPPATTRKGRGYRPLLKSEIIEARAKCKTEAATARRLGVSFKTLKKYSKDFGLWQPTKAGRKKQ